MATLDDLLGSFTNEKTAAATTDKFYDEKKAEWTEIQTAYQDLRGISKGQNILNMLAPMAAKMGWKLPMAGGLGALLTGFSANEGGFSEILGNIPILGKFFGMFSGFFG